MKLVDVKVKVKCDMPNCKSFADFKIENEGFLKNAGLYLCRECTENLYKTIAEKVVPKSPNNMLNKKILSKKGEINVSRV